MPVIGGERLGKMYQVESRLSLMTTDERGVKAGVKTIE